jgi:hypothetical protein
MLKYYSYNIPRIIRYVVHVACKGERGGIYRFFWGKPEGKKLLGRHRHRWEDSIKMRIQDVGGWGKEWIELVQDRDRWQECVNEPLGSIK